MLHVARRAEELGYASLWTFQRVLSPAGGGLDPSFDAAHNPAVRPADDASYRAVHDPLVPLALVAGCTERIGQGTATVCALFTAPALLAASMASLDVLSDGRLTAGLGIGWLPHEYVAAGVPFERRGARMEEYLRCLHALWTQDPVSSTGSSTAVPARARACRRCSGPIRRCWSAAARRRRSVAPGGWPRAGSAARDPDAVRILVRAVVDLVARGAEPDRRPMHETREQVLDDLAVLRAQGVTEVVVDLDFSPRVGSPDVDAGEAMDHVEHVLETLAPSSCS